jgi:hypothetical protein
MTALRVKMHPYPSTTNLRSFWERIVALLPRVISIALTFAEDEVFDEIRANSVYDFSGIAVAMKAYKSQLESMTIRLDGVIIRRAKGTVPFLFGLQSLCALKEFSMSGQADGSVNA